MSKADWYGSCFLAILVITVVFGLGYVFGYDQATAYTVTYQFEPTKAKVRAIKDGEVLFEQPTGYIDGFRFNVSKETMIQLQRENDFKR